LRDTVQWYEETALASTFVAVPHATRSVLRVEVSLLSIGDQFEAVFANKAGRTTTHIATLTGAQSTGNWAGYALAGSTFTSVSATWVVPTVECSDPTTTYADEWIGIDGLSSLTIEQIGTETDCIDGQPVYSAWYEMLGDTAVGDGNQVATGGVLSPGDTVHASVTETAGVWTLVLTDLSAGWTSTIVEDSPTPTPAQSSAELIVERPGLALSNTMDGLADFTSATFTDVSLSSSATTGTLSSFPRYNITMTNAGVPAAVAGPLSSSGSSFTVTFLAPT
jgi:hypothetical protein